MQARPHVSILLQDMASPVLGPVLTLAGFLQPDYAVQIVGPDVGRGVCGMYRDAFPYTIVDCPRMYRLPDYLWERRKLEQAVTGDVIIAVKAFASSVPVALAAKRHRGAKVLAYLDEWDGAMMARLSPAARWKRRLKHFHHPMDDIYCPLVERLLPACDSVISTTTALQKKFGGEVIPCGVDMAEFTPHDQEETEALRREYGLQDKRLIVFGGVVRPHKGIELILAALAEIGNPQNQLVIVGPVNEHVRELQQNPAFSAYLTALGARPKNEMPLHLSLADLIVLPLNDDPLAQTQMPCKVFEAMALGKPIIAGRVADLPQVLEGCGWLVPPDDAAALAEQIRYVFAHPDDAAAMGRRAREKCAAQYSRDVAGAQLRQLIAKVLASS